MELKEIIKRDNIEVFHEQTTDGSHECVFVLLDKNKYKNFASTIDSYVPANKVEGISQQSLDYFNSHKTDAYIVQLGKLPRDMLFFDQELKLIEQNIHNEVSKKLTGEVVDVTKNCETFFDKYTYRTGAITSSTVSLASEAIQKTVEQLKDKKPQEILDIGSQKLNKAITGFRDKLKSRMKP